MNASTSSGPDGRMSRPTSIRGALREAGEADTEGVGDLGVELVGDGATHVVRLDDVVEHLRVGRGHGA